MSGHGPRRRGRPGLADERRTDPTSTDTGTDTGTPGQRFTSDAVLIEVMSSRIQFSWDRYITFIHQILLLTGGTILILINGMFGKDARPEQHYTGVGVTAIGVAVLGMVAGMGWRLTSQYFMDREVFGARDDVQRYFDLCGIRSVTDYDVKYYSERQYRQWRRLFTVSSTAAIVALFSAWLLGGAYVFLNAR